MITWKICKINKYDLRGGLCASVAVGLLDRNSSGYLSVLRSIQFLGAFVGMMIVFNAIGAIALCLKQRLEQ
jgi:hypothetical protein